MFLDLVSRSRNSQRTNPDAQTAGSPAWSVWDFKEGEVCRELQPWAPGAVPGGVSVGLQSSPASRLCYLQKVGVDFSSCVLVTYCNGLEPTSLLPLLRTPFESSDTGARAWLLVGGCSLSSLSATDGKDLVKLLAVLLAVLLAADAGLHPALSA